MKILITGTDYGLGRALAEVYLQAGHTVFAGELNPRKSMLGKADHMYRDRLYRIKMDVTSITSVKEAFDEIRKYTESLDMIINNAAILGDITKTIVEELDFDEMKRVIDTNAIGHARVCHHAVPMLLESETKLLVNITSEAGSLGTPDPNCDIPSAYGYFMSKAAANMCGKITATYLRDKGGRVFIIHPLYMATYMLGYKEPNATFEPEEVADMIIGITNEPDRFFTEGRNLCFISADGRKMEW